VSVVVEREDCEQRAGDLDALDRKPFWWRFGVGLSRLAAPVL
jgi:hypothetical protein